MKPTFNKFPSVKVTKGNHACIKGWTNICRHLKEKLQTIPSQVQVLVVETYHGVYDSELIEKIKSSLSPTLFLNVKYAMLDEKKIKRLVYPDVTDDRIFGYMTRLRIEQFFDPVKLAPKK